MKCPRCGDSELELTSSAYDEEHCSLDFDCTNCGCVFTANYVIEQEGVVIDDADEDDL